MLKAIEVIPDIYWVGAINWDERLFDGHAIDKGGTYNAYLIMDEHITLIDTVEHGFTDQLIERISSVVDPTRIDYLIMNHNELDHSGALPRMLEVCPNAQLIASAPQGEKIIHAFFGQDIPVRGVRTSDTLSIGRRTLTFTTTPMVHWPDNMVTYCPEDRILFSNDALGQHLATSKRFDDEVDLPTVMHESKSYYANIVWPYSKQTAKALQALVDLKLDLIAPAHGLIWRSHVQDILDAYTRWAACEPDGHATIVYDSMYGTTEAMARQAVETFMQAGISVELFDLKHNSLTRILASVMDAKYLLVGSPTLNMHPMPNVASFLDYLAGLAPKGLNRLALAFGSYGWAPRGPQMVGEALTAAGYTLAADPVTHQWTTTEEALQAMSNAVENMIKKI